MNDPRVPSSAVESADSRRLKILILNQSYWPDHVATAQHAHDLARSLVAAGHTVTVIASRTLYGQRGHRLRKEESVEGVQVFRVAGGGFGKGSFIGRILDFAAFFILGALRAIRLPRHDVVICLTTPPFLPLVGMLIRLLKGSRCILWSMDLYPDLPAAAGLMRKQGLMYRLLEAIDTFAMRSVDRVVVLGRCMRERVLARGVPASQLELIHPWADPQEIGGESSRQRPGSAGESSPVQVPGSSGNAYRQLWGIGSRFVIEYAGNCGFGHDIQTVFRAMEALRDDDSIRWVFIGGGVFHASIEEFARDRGIRNVIVKPYQPRESLGECLSLGDVHLVLLSTGFEGIILPSKFYGVMAAARPAIFVGPAGAEAAKVIVEERCGVVVPDGESELLVKVLKRLQQRRQLARMLGRRGRLALEARYSSKIACRAWRAMISDLVGRSTEVGVGVTPIEPSRGPLNILVISQYFPPDITAAAYRIGDSVRLLRERGHSVRVITSTPHKGGLDDEDRIGISAECIIRIPVHPLEDRKATSYIGQYLGFVGRAFVEAMKLRREFRYDVIWASSPPLFIALCTIALRFVARRPVVLDVRDLWPETAVNVGKVRRGSLTERFGKLLESAAYRLSDRITCVSRPMSRYIGSRTNRPVHVVYNGAPSDQIGRSPGTGATPQVFCYAGNLGYCQGLEGVIAAFAEATTRPGMGDARLRFIGTGVLADDLARMASERGLADRVEFLGVKPKREALNLMSQSGALLIPLQDSPAFELTVPSKVFDCMGLAMPIIASIRGEGREILSRSGGNIVVNPDDVSALADAMHAMRESWEQFNERAQANARIVSADFSREAAVSELESALRQAAGRGSV